MTRLLNGQAVKVGLASTSVTAMRGSMRRMKRAQVAPPNPPPTTTTRPPAPWAMAGSGSTAAEAPATAVLRKSRRLVRCAVMIGLPSSILLRAIPGSDGLDLVVGEALGDAAHHGRGKLSRLERLHRGDDVCRIAAVEPRDGRVRRPGCGVAAGAGEGAGRSIRRAGRRSAVDQCKNQGGGNYNACGIHVRASRNAAPCRSRPCLFWFLMRSSNRGF